MSKKVSILVEQAVKYLTAREITHTVSVDGLIILEGLHQRVHYWVTTQHFINKTTSEKGYSLINAIKSMGLKQAVLSYHCPDCDTVFTVGYISGLFTHPTYCVYCGTADGLKNTEVSKL